jgi:galactonate dehydratase
MSVKAASVFVVKSAAMRPVILRLETADGLTGIGEATVCYGVGASAAAAMIVEMCERFVLGAG